MPSTTRAAIRQELHDRLYGGDRTFRRLRRGPDATGLTEFTTGMAAVVDTAQQDTMLVQQEFIGWWIRLKYLDDASATQERVSRIHQFDPSSGTIPFAPAIGTVNGTAGSVNGEYEIWPGVHPDEADSAINRILAETYYKAYVPITLCTDGDMEDSGVTNWAAVGSPTTRDKAASTLPLGRQSLSLASAAAATGATSNSIPVSEGEPLFVSAFMHRSSGALQIVLRDATASADITTVTVPSRVMPLHAWFQASAPASCQNVAIRSLASTSAASVWQLGFVSVLSQWRDRYPIDATTVETAEDVLDVLALPRGQSIDTDTYVGQADGFYSVPFKIEEQERGGLPLSVVLSAVTGDPHFMLAKQRYPTLTTDASTTVADKEMVVQGALSYLERLRGNERAAQLAWQRYRIRAMEPLHPLPEARGRISVA